MSGSDVPPGGPSPLAALFDAVADSYDSVGVDFFRPIAEGLIREVAPRPGDRALDIGCGRGAVLVPLARAVAPGGTSTGIDLSPRMVELARVAIDDAAVTATAAVDDAMAPGFEPASFEVVTSSLVLFFLPDPAVALAAWRELLAPGGRIGVTTFGPYTEQWRTAVDEVLQRFGPDADGARAKGRRGPFASDEGMEEMVRSAGFDEVRTATTTIPVRFDDPEHWERWSRSVAQRSLWAGMPAGDLDAVRSELYAAVDGCRTDDGRVGFDQQVRYSIALRS